MRERMRTLGKELLFGAIKTVVYSIIVIMVILGATAILGNQQQEALDDINAGTRATVCVLSLPVDDGGRNQALVRQCLIDAGIKP
jgi:hypothetical protein